LTYETVMKKIVSFFDLLLYLLNRRTRPEEICEKKFQIIQKIHESELFAKVEKSLSDQISNYVKRGPL
jgi:hypothetical protein